MPANIVVVDEDRRFVNQLQVILTESGYTAVGLVGRDEAIQTFEQLRRGVDVAVVDFIVPGTTGPELIGMIRRHLPTTKVVATVPAEGLDLTELAEQVEPDLVMRRPKKGQPPEREQWVRAVEDVLAGRV